MLPHEFTKFRVGLFTSFFELIGLPMPNKENSNIMPIYSHIIDTTGGAAAEGRGPPVLSIALKYMGIVLDCPCLALTAQLIQKFNK